MNRRYDTKVCAATKKDPLGFVDSLLKESETARDSRPIMLEAASVIANLLLTNESWQPPKPDSIEKALFDWTFELASIKGALGVPEILAQLAEEAAELAQAALKLRRVLDGTNPAPISEQEAKDNLHEEVADILLCLYTFNADWKLVEPIVRRIAYRWKERLGDDA